jgi:hypothetical protein
MGLESFLPAGLLGPIPPALAVEDLDSHRFLETYRAALVQLRTACSSGELEGDYTSRRFEAGADRPARVASCVMGYSSDGDREQYLLIRRDLASTPYFERVFLPRGGRKLILERIDPDRPFYIRWISRPSEAPDTLAPTYLRDEIVRAAYSIGSGLLIPSILESPSFRIVELGRVDRDGAALVRVAFESSPDAAQSSPELKGWLLLDPGRGWVLREHEVRMAWPASPDSLSVTRGTVRYADEVGAPPLPEEVTLETRFGRDGRLGEHRIHFQARRRSTEPPPAVALTLTAYGLGDYPWDIEERLEGRGLGRLNVDPRVLPFERPEPGASVALSFRLTNAGLEPVRVVGMRVGCAGIPPDKDLPCLIEPGQTRTLSLKLQAFSEPEEGETQFPLYLYTTAPGQAEVELTLVGRRNDRRH